MSDGNENRPHTQRNERIMVSTLTGAALWRMQLTFPYNTQLGAVAYRMIMKQCISSTFYSQFTGCVSLGISLQPVTKTNAFLCYCFLK